MRQLLRAVLSAVPALALFAAAAAASTSAEAQATPITTATALLAAVTSPLLADATVTADRSFATDTVVRPDDSTLDQLVAANATPETADEEEECLAASVYFESKGEPLAGQLAVAQTVLNRAGSGRYPPSACGVVRQPGQFSFVRGGALPDVRRDSQAWRFAVAIARIARGDLWKAVAPGALMFHAARLSPSWRATRVARLGNHVFYR